MPDRNPKGVLPWLLAPLAAILLLAAAGSALPGNGRTRPGNPETPAPERPAAPAEVLSRSTYRAAAPEPFGDVTYTVLNAEICVDGRVYLQSIAFSSDRTSVGGFSTIPTTSTCGEWRKRHAREQTR